MGTVLASTIVSRAAQIVQDEVGTGVGGIIYLESEGLDWLNEAQINVSDLRPDASLITHSIQLLAGVTQSISGRQLIEVSGNMGSDGLTPGRPVRLVERGIKDEFEPGWRSDVPATVVREYIYNKIKPDKFDVWPPVPVSPAVYIQITESINPANIATINDTITIDDSYQGALLEWVLYRYFARDSERSNLTSMSAHFQNFFSMLNVKLNADMAVNPKHREQLK